MTESEFEKAATEQLLTPKSVEVDGQKVENHNGSDLIEMARFMASKNAVSKRSFPVRITRMVAGGAAL